MTNLLTMLETSGSQGVLPASATLTERNALHLHIIALKAQGHAIVFSDVIENEENGSARSITVTHYKSCEM